MPKDDLEIFLVAPPGLEHALLSEAEEKGFSAPRQEKGGLTVFGDWSEVWRANLVLRGASKVLVRIGGFRAFHLAQLDKRARKFPWLDFLRPDVPVKIEASCKKSKIYHQKAAAERVQKALQDQAQILVNDEADITLKIRILDDVCTFSLDTSGAGLHKRGSKVALNKAPLRETLAALCLRACDYTGTEPVLDPMCGSGTFILEAAEIACNLAPGRHRSFAFEQLTSFDPDAWQDMISNIKTNESAVPFYGYDRDHGAIELSRDNAARAGLSEYCRFERQTISAIKAPDGPSGLVMINPPYGKRLGEVKKLLPLYQSMGHTLSENFKGWRVGLITNEEKLARSTTLPFQGKPVSFNHGGIPVKLYKTQDLK